MTYTYFDAILASQVTDDYEARAINDLASLGYTNTPATAYLYQQLVVFKVYQIMAIELSTDSGDIYAQKLTHYKKEFDAIAAQYKAQIITPATAGASAKSMRWGRG